MAAPIKFESSWEKEKYREICRKEREKILAQAKAEFERKEKRKEDARQQGEGTWMLPALDSRIQSEEQELEKALSGKHKKKHKKEKKSKKKKKHRSRSESSSDKEAVWQEKSNNTSKSASTSIVNSENSRVLGPKLERDSWMTSSTERDIFSGFNLGEQRRNAKAEARKAEADAMEEMRSKRELNPYWKNGGTGMPPELIDHNPPAPSASKLSANDGGLSWWRKAYQRCKELAEAEGRSLEEVAAERYGSLEELTSKLQHAEAADKSNHSRSSARDDYNDRGLKSLQFRRPGYDGSSDKYSSSREKHASSSVFRQSDSDDDSEIRRSSSSRPSERPSTSASWRKKDAPPVKHERDQRDHERQSDTISFKGPASSEQKTSGRKRSPSSSSDSSESSSSDSSVEKNKESAKSNTTSTAPETKPVVKVLSEQEMNQLGAKILKAELMGNEKLARELKDQLEAARRLSASKPPVVKASGSKPDGDEEVVVLSRTDSRGLVRPLPERKHPIEPTKGRRKKQKVSTHDKKGERERYFDDDDDLGLKAMVEREKLGTAEDQNRMFARLAGRGLGRTDDEYQMDDALLDKAARKQSQSHLESRERQLAIIEHKKMSASLDKCQFCFGNIPKHLIVAIGIKVCLIVPSHRSMNDGHCLIVPMQHVTQSTVVDEDVWDEIKIFRKGLARMFDDSDQDCVFLETAMNLKRLPHMYIECIPLPKHVGDTAPIYFKKAIMECEAEWADNKKLVDLSKKDIRKSIPKGFAYFSVDFGLQGGYAHVIEDEKSFPAYFGREVVGGMLDLEPLLWRKPHQERFDSQRKKVLKFAEMWKPYDWTQRLKQENDSDKDDDEPSKETVSRRQEKDDSPSPVNTDDDTE